MSDAALMQGASPVAGAASGAALGAAPRAARGRYALALLMALADLYVIGQWVTGGMPTLSALAAHLAASAAYGVLMLVMLRARPAETAVALALLLLLGPLGGLVLVLTEVTAGAVPIDLDTRRDVVRQGPPPSAAQVLYHEIVQNRRPRLDGTLPESLVSVLDRGDMTEKYRVIATISQHYTPEMLPALRHALASPVPVVRVQAAAVYAKLRGDFEARALAQLKEPPAATSAAARLRMQELRGTARSGFVAEEQAAQLMALARAEQDRVAMAAFGGAADATPAAATPPAAVPAGQGAAQSRFKGAG